MSQRTFPGDREMPDDEPRQVSDEEAAAAGIFTAAELAALVAFSTEVQQLAGGDILGDDDAYKLLLDRLGGELESNNYYHQGSDANRADYAQIILESIPSELRTDAVMKGIDLRPYLAALDGKKIAPWLQDASGNRPAQDMARVAHTAGDIEKLTAQLEKDMLVPTAGTEFTQAERNAMLAKVSDWKPGETGLVNTPEQLAFMAGEAGEDVLSTAPASSQMVNHGFIESDLQGLVDMDMLTIEQLVDMEGQRQAEVGGGYFHVGIGVQGDNGLKTTNPSGLGAPRTVSAYDALHYLYTLDEKQVADMQRKLGAAGYFDQTRSGGGYIEGDPTDPVTAEAWALMLTESIKRQTPITQVMGERTRSYRAKVREARLKATTEIDPFYQKTVANDWARQEIGRDLTNEELLGMQAYLQELTRKRAGYVAGATNNPTSRGGMMTDDGEFIGVDSQDMQSYVDQTTQDEQSLAQQGAWHYALQRKLGG